MKQSILLAQLLLLSTSVPAFGQGFVESVFPPVVERGQTTRVTVRGNDFGTALGLWHSLPKGALSAKPVESASDRLVLDATAAKDAPVGICGIRVATVDGLTNAIPFLVDDLPVRAGDSGMSLTLPASVWGTLRPAAVDRYRISVTAGEKLSLELVGNRFGKDADPMLTIRDASGRWIAERDNDPGLYFDCRFEHTFAEAGTYTLEVRDARFEGSEHHAYVLRVGRFPAARVAVPATLGPGRNEVRLPELDATATVSVPSDQREGPFFAEVKRPGDDGSAWIPVERADSPTVVVREPLAARSAGFEQLTSGPTSFAYWLSPLRANPFLPLERMLNAGTAQATPIQLPVTVCGVLREPGVPHVVTFRMKKGDRLYARVDTKSLNSPADLELVVVDRSGRELRRNQPSRTGDDEPTLDFNTNAPGEYGLVIRDLLRDGSPAHSYRVHLRRDPFPPEITAEVEGLTVPQGSYQVVPIVVTRTGPATPIRLRPLDAPPGLRLTPSELAENENSIVCRLEADKSTPLGIFTFQIQAELLGTDPPRRVLVRTTPLLDRKRVNRDLVPYALREDQTRLPPSLTDRFAVQITPPSPYTFELDADTVTLIRYTQSPIPIVTTRVNGFNAPLSFRAEGGQLAPKEEGRTRVYAEFPEAISSTSKVNGVVVSKILSNIAKPRIDVTSTGADRGRRISLTRSFTLDLVTAFEFGPEQTPVSLLPGESGMARVVVVRRPGNDGPLTITFNSTAGLKLPDSVAIPAGKSEVSFEVAAEPDANPGRRRVLAFLTGEVAGYEESVRGQPLDVEIRKPDVKKK